MSWNLLNFGRFVDTRHGILLSTYGLQVERIDRLWIRKHAAFQDVIEAFVKLSCSNHDIVVSLGGGRVEI